MRVGVMLDTGTNTKRQVLSTETNLEYSGDLFGISTIHVCLSDRPHVEEFAMWRGKKHNNDNNNEEY